MLDHAALVLTLAATVAGTSFAGDESFRNTRFGWALVSRGSTIATSTDELDRLHAWTSDGDRVLLARFGEDEYLIRDRVTLDRVDRLVEPVRALGEKARAILAARGAGRSDKLDRREWKERLRPLKEERRKLLHQISGEIETLARDAVRRGGAQRVN